MDRAARFLGYVLTIGAAAALLLWAVGRVFTDRSLYTQYIYWIPAWMVIAGAGAALVGAAVVSRLEKRGKRSRGLARARLYTGTGWVLVLAAFLVADLRVLNVLKSRPQRAGLRVMHWNVSGIDTPATINAALEREDPDVVVFVNPWGRVGWEKVIEDFGPPVALAWEYGVLVLAKPPIREYGFTWMGLQNLPPDTTFDFGAEGKRSDPGRAMWLQIDATAELGKPITLVVYDMPSDLRRWRWKLAVNARNAISEWEGPRIVRDDRGQTTKENVEAFGFPKADVVLGDFNIPRGSDSLRVLAPGMANAFDQGGLGYAATYPRWRPLVHIDQTFVGPGLRATRYRVVDPGGPSSHLYQVTDLVAAGE